MDDAPQIAEQGFRTNISTLARWKRVLLAFASLLIVVGAAWMPFEKGDRSDLARTEEAAAASDEETPGSGALEVLTGSGAGAGLLPGGPTLPLPGTGGSGSDDPRDPPSSAGNTTSDETLSPALLQMGFSFFAAFAVGLAFRSFLKVALVFVGMQLLALFGLSYVDWITVHWDTMSDAFDRFVAGARGEFESFQAFVTGSLPQVGLASLGLVAGFKR